MNSKLYKTAIICKDRTESVIFINACKKDGWLWNLKDSFWLNYMENTCYCFEISGKVLVGHKKFFEDKEYEFLSFRTWYEKFKNGEWKSLR